MILKQKKNSILQHSTASGEMPPVTTRSSGSVCTGAPGCRSGHCSNITGSALLQRWKPHSLKNHKMNNRIINQKQTILYIKLWHIQYFIWILDNHFKKCRIAIIGNFIKRQTKPPVSLVIEIHNSTAKCNRYLKDTNCIYLYISCFIIATLFFRKERIVWKRHIPLNWRTPSFAPGNHKRHSTSWWYNRLFTFTSGSI